MADNGVDKFEIRAITESSTVLKKFFLDLLEKENWFPGVHDVELYLAIDPTSLYVGELNGKPIATAAMIKYGDDYRHCGCFVVEEGYRGRGYGMKMTAETWRRSEPNDVVSGYSVPEMVENYREVLKAVPHWPTEKHIVDIAKALSSLEDHISSRARPDFSIKQVSEVDSKALCEYDTKVFGYKREKFLGRLLETSYARVAVDELNEIVGYAVARVLYNQDGGFKVGPVFCESIETAVYLLKEIFQDILDSEAKRSTKRTVVIDFLLKVNPGVNEFANILGGEILSSFMFLSCNGLPSADFKKWFAITSLEAG